MGFWSLLPLLFSSLSFALAAGTEEKQPLIARPIVVIVNQSQSIEALSRADLAKIFQGQLTRWPDGRNIVVVDRPMKSAIRSQFYTQYVHLNPEKRFFRSGSPIPFDPIVQEEDIGVSRFVGTFPNSVGYIYQENVTARCKILKVKE